VCLAEKSVHAIHSSGLTQFRCQYLEAATSQVACRRRPVPCRYTMHLLTRECFMHEYADVWLRNARCRGGSHRDAASTILDMSVVTCRFIDFDSSTRLRRRPAATWICLHEGDKRGRSASVQQSTDSSGIMGQSFVRSLRFRRISVLLSLL
jgi:hypothetical protein